MNKNIKLVTYTILFLLLQLGINSHNSGYSTLKAQKVIIQKEDGLFENMPEKMHNSAIERLGFFIESLNNKDWSGLFELMDKQRKANLTKEQFIQQIKYNGLGSIVSYKIQQVYKDESSNDRWVVKGKAKYFNDGKYVKYKTIIIMTYINENWYLYDLGHPIETTE